MLALGTPDYGGKVILQRFVACSFLWIRRQEEEEKIAFSTEAFIPFPSNQYQRPAFLKRKLWLQCVASTTIRCSEYQQDSKH